ncbi:ligase-associated DNA damage response endonuclease PdeM [Parasulfitobacter algicola]|uniref:Ligase-associated DNA damage response endonuclease PdeM n=1 Tax=Parasulfitobacter algicola TaxID=2614809 RepID=A0ABX2ISZ6_9RHOB|nr:ligase-associated DNA damage response endonuclease PdeM [Sulfitobacter algicola]NSX54205.1 ligase-associated DNA damage response endonuclease PdeM [Sulfitobacter algicola]
MNGYEFNFAECSLTARASGALWWADQRVLCVSDLHLGKSDRIARRAGLMLPPYETRDTLARLEAEIDALLPDTVICLGDSFDDLAAADSLDEDETLWLTRLQAGRRWIWIEGNHDPGPVDFGGTHLAELTMYPLTFRHIATKTNSAEISGHYHPKASLNVRGRTITRKCFLQDENRIILPAFGTYTGGLHSHSAALSQLMTTSARAFLLGQKVQNIPMPR